MVQFDLRDKGVHAFSKDISLRLELELTHPGVTVQHFSSYATIHLGYYLKSCIPYG